MIQLCSRNGLRSPELSSATRDQKRSYKAVVQPLLLLYAKRRSSLHEDFRNPFCRSAWASRLQEQGPHVGACANLASWFLTAFSRLLAPRRWISRRSSMSSSITSLTTRWLAAGGTLDYFYLRTPRFHGFNLGKQNPEP